MSLQISKRETKGKKNTPNRSSFKPQAADTHKSNDAETGTVASLAEVGRVAPSRGVTAASQHVNCDIRVSGVTGMTGPLPAVTSEYQSLHAGRS